jgi:hypothetical protein
MTLQRGGIEDLAVAYIRSRLARTIVKAVDILRLYASAPKIMSWANTGRCGARNWVAAGTRNEHSATTAEILLRVHSRAAVQGRCTASSTVLLRLQTVSLQVSFSQPGLARLIRVRLGGPFRRGRPTPRRVTAAREPSTAVRSTVQVVSLALPAWIRHY